MIAIYISSKRYQYLTVRKTYTQARDVVIADIVKNGEVLDDMCDLYITDRNGDPLIHYEVAFTASLIRALGKNDE